MAVLRKPLSREALRASVWFWPMVGVAATLVGSFALLGFRPGPETFWAHWLWPADRDAAGAMLQTVAGAIMTAATVTFSLTVVALQLASQQYSPRLLREFARDNAVQGVLGLLVATFVAALVALRGLEAERPLPVLLLAIVFVMGITSACALLMFVGHIVKSLRVETMMAATHAEAVPIIERTYPPYGAPSEGFLGMPPGFGILLPALRSGFVREIEVDSLVAVARDHGMLIRMNVRPGDHVVEGMPLAEAFSPSDTQYPDGLDVAVGGCVELGFERTSEQDAALGLRRLTDIAVKAISPSINDPVTAASAVGYCTDLMIKLQNRRLGPQGFDDADGTTRLILPGRDLRYFLDLVCGPIRRFGRGEPMVLTALLQMLRDCGTSSRDSVQSETIVQQVELILEEMSGDLLAYDKDAVHDQAERVRLAIAGETASAFLDRAGETRST